MCIPLDNFFDVSAWVLLAHGLELCYTLNYNSNTKRHKKGMVNILQRLLIITISEAKAGYVGVDVA